MLVVHRYAGCTISGFALDDLAFDDLTVDGLAGFDLGSKEESFCDLAFDTLVIALVTVPLPSTATPNA